MPFNSITTLYPPGRGIGNGPRQRVEVVGPRVVARRASPRPGAGRAFRPPSGADAGRRSVPALYSLRVATGIR